MHNRAAQLKIQQKQTRYMLMSFHQTLAKCLRYTRDLEVDFPNKKQYEEFQRKSKFKVDVLDVASLLTLKQEIKKKHDQLISLQNDLSYQHSNKMKKKDYFKPTIFQNLKQSPENMKQETNSILLSQTQINASKITKNVSKVQIEKPESFLPMYFIRNDTTQNKLDSISKFIAQLKRSMKKQVQAPQQMPISNFLMMQPQYLKLKQQLQRYKMHHEQFIATFNQRVQQQASKYIDNCQVVQQNNDYKTIKIYKEDKKSIVTKIQSERNDTQQEQENRILDQLDITEEVPYEYQLMKKVQKDFEQMMKSLGEDTGMTEKVFEKGEESIVNIETNLKMMRAKRKQKLIEDDDIWKQISKN